MPKKRPTKRGVHSRGPARTINLDDMPWEVKQRYWAEMKKAKKDR